MPAKKQWSILLIESSPDLQSLIRLSLELAIDPKIQTALSATEGIELAQVHHPDTIFLYINHNGLEILQKLKSEPITRNIPLVAFTNRVRLSDRIKIQRHGAKALLEYPFDPVVLKKVLQEIMESIPNPSI